MRTALLPGLVYEKLAFHALYVGVDFFSGFFLHSIKEPSSQTRPFGRAESLFPFLLLDVFHSLLIPSS